MNAVPGPANVRSGEPTGSERSAPLAASSGVGADPRRLILAAALVIGPCLLFVAVGALLVVARSQGFVVGYEYWVRSLMTVLAALVPLGLVAAVVVLLWGRTWRVRAASSPDSVATPSRVREYRHLRWVASLRTRAFVVIAVCVLVPSVCLSAFGVWAYFKSWDRATALYDGQAYSRAQTVQDEIVNLSRSPARFTPAERALLSVAIVTQAGIYGQQNGAVVTTLAEIRSRLSLAPPLVRSLRRNGYALAMDKTLVTNPTHADIVAWVGPGGAVYVYAPGWNGPAPRFSVEVPTARLVRLGGIGLALTALLGLLGAWILSASVVRPVRRLAQASGRLAEGEAGVTVTPTGPRELRDLAIAFNDMNARMTKAQEAEQSFLLSVSHELKTPLTSIRGYAEALDDGALPAPEAAAVIGTESARLERLVGDLLDSARMRKSAFTVRSETVDLAEVAREVARRHEGAAREAGLALDLDLAPDSLALADHDRVLQIVSNLVENAVRCTPSGSVRIGTGPGLVSVADSGRGLTSDDLPRAFERFYLYSRYGHDRPIGTGLGLSIVKELTEAMGGRVRVSSAVGVGTAFVVELPSAPTGAAPPAPPAPPPLGLPEPSEPDTLVPAGDEQ